MRRERERGIDLEPGRLRALREAAGWSQRRAADLAHVTENQYGRWERGEQRISGAAWELLCLKAGVTQAWQPGEPVAPVVSATRGAP